MDSRDRHKKPSRRDHSRSLSPPPKRREKTRSPRPRSPPHKKPKIDSYKSGDRSRSPSISSRRYGRDDRDRPRSPRRERDRGVSPRRGYSPVAQRRSLSPHRRAKKDSYNPPPRGRTPPRTRERPRSRSPKELFPRTVKERSPERRHSRSRDRSRQRPSRPRSPELIKDKKTGDYSPPSRSPVRKRSPKAPRVPLPDPEIPPREKPARPLRERIERSKSPRPDLIRTSIQGPAPPSDNPNPSESTPKPKPADATVETRIIEPAAYIPPSIARGRGRGRAGAPIGRGRGGANPLMHPRYAAATFAPPRAVLVKGRGDVHNASDRSGQNDASTLAKDATNGTDASHPVERTSPDNIPRGPRGYTMRGRVMRGRGRGGRGGFYHEASFHDPQVTLEAPESQETADFEMPPPSRPAGEAETQPVGGPFRAVGATPEKPVVAIQPPRGPSFRPFTMNLSKVAKTPTPKLVPKALETPKFTGSNDGRQLDISARIARTKGSDRREYDPPSNSRSRRRSPPRNEAPPPPPPPPKPLKPELIIKEMQIYHKVSMVGEGTYGKVYKASNNLTKELVALKRIRMEGERDGVCCMAFLISILY